MRQPVRQIAEAVSEHGGRALIVGGWVRDKLLGLELDAADNIDIEVYGVEPDALKRLLRRIGRVNTVGESFTVYKMRVGAVEYDVSIPRRESKTGRGHRGFTVVGDPTMTVEEAARRRDFTINAILYDPLSGEIIDPFDGARDLESRLLRVVDPTTFVEDSLRVLRGAQFIARFGLHVDDRTVALCRETPLSDLPAERVWGEMEKLLLRADEPSIGLEALRTLGALGKLFDELDALGPEEWAATKRTCDAARGEVAARALEYSHEVALMLAALCAEVRLEGVARLLEKLNVHAIGGFDVRRHVLHLVEERDAPAQLFDAGSATRDGDIRRLVLRADGPLLAMLTRARGAAEAADWLEGVLHTLDLVEGPPKPLLLGRHVLELGVESGPEIGRITRAIYELQLDGEVCDLDGAIAAATKLLRGEPA